MIKHAGCVVKDQAIDLANADDDLERVAQRVGGRNERGDNEAERAPGELRDTSSISIFMAR